jgi:predicted phosphate transport protein (TIGR00153 family)
MKWFINRNKKPNRFLELLSQQADLTVKGIEVLKQYMQEPDETLREQLDKIEKEADEVRRILIDELNHTFVTPFDREDIFALSLAIDDMVDYANSTLDEMVMLRVKTNQYLARIASLLADAAMEVPPVLRLEDHQRPTTLCGPRPWRTVWSMSTASRWWTCSRRPKIWMG